ncbi:MAG TPA: hypothetical protein VFS75_00590 [Candidatus Paceibacterota bacterium]|nr:hypothetical protein [Candidatus Paceibacterota bacterium]
MPRRKYTLWDPPPAHLRTPLRASAKLTKRELAALKKDIEQALEEEKRKSPWLGHEASQRYPLRRYDAAC